MAVADNFTPSIAQIRSGDDTYGIIAATLAIFSAVSVFANSVARSDQTTFYRKDLASVIQEATKCVNTTDGVTLMLKTLDKGSVKWASFLKKAEMATPKEGVFFVESPVESCQEAQRAIFRAYHNPNSQFILNLFHDNLGEQSFAPEMLGIEKTSVAHPLDFKAEYLYEVPDRRLQVTLPGKNNNQPYSL